MQAIRPVRASPRVTPQVERLVGPATAVDDAGLLHPGSASEHQHSNRRGTDDDHDDPALPPAVEEGLAVTRRRHRRRLGWTAALIVLIGVATGAWWLGSSAQSPEQAAARAQEPVASWVTASVELRVLSATVIGRGEVRAEESSSIGVPASVTGDAVVTQVLVSPGDVVTEGSRVVEVSGRPVFVMQGDVPVFRTLRPGMSGADVTQLQASLTRLGFAPESDGVFGEATKLAVAAFYSQAGYEALPTSATGASEASAAELVLVDAEAAVTAAELAVVEASQGERGSVVAQAEAVRNDALRSLDAALAAQDTAVELARQESDVAVAARDRLMNDPEAEPGDVEHARLEAERAAVNLVEVEREKQHAVDATREALRVATLSLAEVREAGDTRAAQAELDAAVVVRDRAAAALATVVAANGPTVSQGEVVFVPTMPARVLNATSTLGPIKAGPPTSGGDVAPLGDGLVELAGGRLVVSSLVRPGDVGLLRVGLPVELLDEASSVVYPASISTLSAEAVTGADGQLGHPAVLTSDEPLPDSLTGANVRVTITAASTSAEALVVPLAAVSSAADGSTRVSVIGDPNGAPVDVAVVAGLSADGFVVIEPVKAGEVAPGDLVVVGS